MIITETTKPHAACVRNLGARARKTDPGLNSPEMLMLNNISPSDLANLNVSPDSLLECIGHLKHGKSDGTSLSSDFLIYAAPVADALAQLFTCHSLTWLCSRFTSRLSYSAYT